MTIQAEFRQQNKSKEIEQKVFEIGPFRISKGLARAQHWKSQCAPSACAPPCRTNAPWPLETKPRANRVLPQRTTT